MNYLIGSIAGDIIGSIYEHQNITIMDFPLFTGQNRFTDDTVLVCAIADAALSGADYGDKLKEWHHLYPDAGYGARFSKWATSNHKGYSIGNGAAARAASLGFIFATLDDVLREAKLSTLPSHNSQEAINGAQAVASAVFLARTGHPKDTIKRHVETYGYNLSLPSSALVSCKFDSTCPGTIPKALTAFLDSTDFEHAVRLAILLGGDSDTIACITGGIAQAYYRVPEEIEDGALASLDERLRLFVKYASICPTFRCGKLLSHPPACDIPQHIVT